MISCIYGLVDVAVVGQYQGPAGYGGIVYCSADLDNFVQFGDFDRQRRFYQIYILQGTGKDRRGKRLLLPCP